MSSPDELGARTSLRSALDRHEQLSWREVLSAAPDEETADRGAGGATPLERDEALELLALGEVIARKAARGRQLTVRTARARGATWNQIGEALGITKQSAWYAYSGWIDEQERLQGKMGHEGLSADDTARARALAGRPEETEDVPPAAGVMATQRGDFR